MKYAVVTGIVRWSGGSMELIRGKSADDNHPLVVERPDLFGDQPPEAELAGPPPADEEEDAQEQEQPPAPVVERATAAPGEKRTLSRRSTSRKPGTKGEANE
jgi:hypothetical protein